VADGGTLGAGHTSARDYGQTVVTARVACTGPQRNMAFERFTPEGPLALLPTGDSYALVWTTTPEHAQELCAHAEQEFLARLQAAFGGRVGRFVRAGARSCHPIAMKLAERIAESRVVAVGNAAQTLHPVAGQGFNLGLRDAWELATLLRECSRESVGAEPLLARYRARRRLDRRGGIGFTDALVRLFSNDLASVKVARGLGLALLGAVPPARDFVVRRMTFGARG
jgi:2-octaprenyl-6-methoxyphenol hydroxylase